MGLAVEIITGHITNAAAFAGVTPNTGDSFNVRDFNEQVGARLEDVWGNQVTSQTIRIRSPRMHDSSNGIRLVTFPAQTRALMPHESEEPMYPSDALTVESSGTAAEVDIVAYMMYYRDLPGITARLETWDALKSRVQHILALQQTLAAPAVAGDYGAGTAIDSVASALKANTDYAILGYILAAECGTVGIKGTDFGNLRVGGPGSGEADDTREWFVRQSMLHGTPHIPIFNSNNKGNVLVDQSKVALTTTAASFILAELA